jgi:hypothetical protein
MSLAPTQVWRHMAQILGHGILSFVELMIPRPDQ